MYQLSSEQKLELREALVIALTVRADADGKIVGCDVHEFADRILRSFERRMKERLSLTRHKVFLN